MANSSSRIDPPVRLRRAILGNDLSLVKRILKSHPGILQNPDLNDLANTSLHLAAANGFIEIVEFLVQHDHETAHDAGFLEEEALSNPPTTLSFNIDHSTPLHLAAANSQYLCARYLAEHFPQSVNRPNVHGLTALMLACQSIKPPFSYPPFPSTSSSTVGTASATGPKPASHHPSHSHQKTSSSSLANRKERSSSSNSSNDPAKNTATIETLLEHGADVTIVDCQGNTALHHASAWGNLKALRILVAAGADPMAKNMRDWTPVSYSCTVQAEVYFKNFVMEWEKRKAGGSTSGSRSGSGGGSFDSASGDRVGTVSSAGKGGGGIRIVTSNDSAADDEETTSSEQDDDSFASG